MTMCACVGCVGIAADGDRYSAVHRRYERCITCHGSGKCATCKGDEGFSAGEGCFFCDFTGVCRTCRGVGEKRRRGIA